MESATILTLPSTGIGFQLEPNIPQTCLKGPLSKRQNIGLQDQLSLNAGQKYCRMLQGEHSAILSTCVKLLFVFKIFVLSIFEWPFYLKSFAFYGYAIFIKPVIK